LRLARLCREHASVCVVLARLVLRIVEQPTTGGSVRFIGLDVHRDWCDVAIYEDGNVRSAGRVATAPEQLVLFAQSLGPDDRVGLETTGNALSIARIIEPHVAGVLVADTRNVRAMTHAKVKNDRVDARMIAKLLAAGMLPGVWICDEATRVLRRRIARRTQLVRGRTRARNQIHATLIRNLAAAARPATSSPATGVTGCRTSSCPTMNARRSSAASARPTSSPASSPTSTARSPATPSATRRSAG
jgi:transposase